MEAVISLTKALSWDVAEQLYTRENALDLCQMLFIAIEMAKNERLRVLRLASIECILMMAKIDDNSDISDVEMRHKVAEVFMFFAPGIISGLAAVATEDEKIGHKIILLAIRAWGRMVALQMQTYNSLGNNEPINKNELNHFPQSPCKSKEEVENYLKNMNLNAHWYKTSDDKLHRIIQSITKLTQNSNVKVRHELVQSCMLITNFCSGTIPTSVSKVIEILIILSEDVDIEVSKASTLVLKSFSDNLSLNVHKQVFENLEENLYSAITALPRVFNGLDEQQQLSSLNLVVGYLRLFGTTTLLRVLQSHTHLMRLIQTLIHISELERKDVHLNEEYMIQDLDMVAEYYKPWKNFRYFRNETIHIKLKTACNLLGHSSIIDIISDLLLDIFTNSEESRKEATLILNYVLKGLEENSNINDSIHIIKNVIRMYFDPDYWNLNFEVNDNCTIPQAQNNIIQICLQLEGLSIIASILKEDFKQFLLKILYPILERAGSGHPLIKAAGTTAITNIAAACGYSNITELINKNSDYFAFNVINKIHKNEENRSALNVLNTVMKYGNIAMLSSLSDIVSEVLQQTCDKFYQQHNVHAYLELFQMFVKYMSRCLSIKIVIQDIKSKQQIELEYEEFKVSNLKDVAETENSDAEECEISEENEILTDDFEKPKPPNHIELIVKIVQRTLNFLPSKERSKKLLVLNILKNSLEVIRDWENELLPLVHQIWGPLVERFKEKDDFLIINCSFQLLVTLARLSKDFIRSRTSKDVLPQLISVLVDTARSSYLKDKGSAYRYTQAYKMQLTILQQLARVIIDLDLADAHINSVMEAVITYLNDKQPIPLQEAALSFYCDLAKYDSALVRSMLETFWNNQASRSTKEEYNKNVQIALNAVAT